MKLTVKPTRRITGRFRVAADPELAQRVAILSLLCSGKSTIDNWPNSEASSATLECIRQLGGTVAVDGAVVQIDGRGLHDLAPVETSLDCRAAPTAFWLLAGLLCGQRFTSTLIGDGGVPRPVRASILDLLRRMGAAIEEPDGESLEIRFLPAAIRAAEIQSNSILPYLKSALMTAGLYAPDKVIITEHAPAPDNLERIFPAYGVECEIARPARPPSRRELLLSGAAKPPVEEKFHKRLVLSAPADPLRPVDWTLPGNFSEAAPLIAAAAMRPKSDVVIIDVALNSTRTGLLKVLKRMGMEYTIHRRRLENNEPVGDIAITGHQLKAIKVQMGEIGSLAEDIHLLAAVAGAAEGVTVIRGLNELQDAAMLSLKTTAENLRRMGVKIAELEDGWAIEGPTEWQAAEVNCAGNPAMGMAFAIAGLLAEKETKILNADPIALRFPDFQKVLIQLSGK